MSFVYQRGRHIFEHTISPRPDFRQVQCEVIIQPEVKASILLESNFSASILLVAT